MRNNKNTEKPSDRNYNCLRDALCSVVLIGPFGFLILATGGNPVLLGILGIVGVFCVLIATAE